LLKIVLVNLNYRNGVHKNFAQSLIPALVCSETVLTLNLVKNYHVSNGKCS